MEFTFISEQLGMAFLAYIKPLCEDTLQESLTINGCTLRFISEENAMQDTFTSSQNESIYALASAFQAGNLV